MFIIIAVVYSVFEPRRLNIVGVPNIATRRLCLFVLLRRNAARQIAGPRSTLTIVQAASSTIQLATGGVGGRGV